jgi:hypothetical protein
VPSGKGEWRLNDGTFPMRSSSHSLERISVTFDDDHAVANAGLI